MATTKTVPSIATAKVPSQADIDRVKAQGMGMVYNPNSTAKTPTVAKPKEDPAVKKQNKQIKQAEKDQLANLTAAQRAELLAMEEALKASGLPPAEIKKTISAEKAANKQETTTAKTTLAATGLQSISPLDANNKPLPITSQAGTYTGDLKTAVDGKVQSAIDLSKKLGIPSLSKTSTKGADITTGFGLDTLMKAAATKDPTTGLYSEDVTGGRMLNRAEGFYGKSFTAEELKANGIKLDKKDPTVGVSKSGSLSTIFKQDETGKYVPVANTRVKVDEDGGLFGGGGFLGLGDVGNFLQMGVSLWNPLAGAALSAANAASYGGNPWDIIKDAGLSYLGSQYLPGVVKNALPTGLTNIGGLTTGLSQGVTKLAQTGDFEEALKYGLAAGIGTNIGGKVFDQFKDASYAKAASEFSSHLLANPGDVQGALMAGIGGGIEETWDQYKRQNPNASFTDFFKKPADMNQQAYNQLIDAFENPTGRPSTQWGPALAGGESALQGYGDVEIGQKFKGTLQDFNDQGFGLPIWESEVNNQYEITQKQRTLEDGKSFNYYEVYDPTTQKTRYYLPDDVSLEGVKSAQTVQEVKSIPQNLDELIAHAVNVGQPLSNVADWAKNQPLGAQDLSQIFDSLTGTSGDKWYETGVESYDQMTKSQVEGMKSKFTDAYNQMAGAAAKYQQDPTDPNKSLLDQAKSYFNYISDLADQYNADPNGEAQYAANLNLYNTITNANPNSFQQLTSSPGSTTTAPPADTTTPPGTGESPAPGDPNAPPTDTPGTGTGGDGTGSTPGNGTGGDGTGGTGTGGTGGGGAGSGSGSGSSKAINFALTPPSYIEPDKISFTPIEIEKPQFNPMVFSLSDFSAGGDGGASEAFSPLKLGTSLLGGTSQPAGGQAQGEENPWDFGNRQPQEEKDVWGFAEGGLASIHPAGEPEFHSEGGLQNRYVKGRGDGTSDSIPAMLANDEFVIPADVVSALGNGSSEAGASVLENFMYEIRKHKQSNGPSELPPDSHGPLEYLSAAMSKGK